MHHDRATEPTAEVITEALLKTWRGVALTCLTSTSYQPPIQPCYRSVGLTNYDIGALREVLNDNPVKLN